MIKKLFAPWVVLLTACCLFFGTASAQRGIVGGLAGMEGCLDECQKQVQDLPADGRSGPQECSNYCRCALTIEFIDEMTAPKVEHRMARCRAETWPRVFEQPGPEPKSAREIENERKRVEEARVDAAVAKARAADGGAGLSKHEIRGVEPFDWRYDLETPELRKLLSAAATQGQQVIACTYGPSKLASGGEGFATYAFWYRQPPPSIGTMMNIDRRGALQYLGSKALNECPISDRAALAIRQAAMRESRGAPAVAAPTTTPAESQPDSSLTPAQQRARARGRR